MSERATTERARLLVVEDETNVGSTLVERLGLEGFDVVWAKSVEEAEGQIEGRKFDLALLDVGLPDGSGFSVAKQLREHQRATAIIFLTAFGNPEDRIKGLELGAEDYVVKPFHLKELLLRVQNGLKRARYLASAPDQAKVRIGRAEIDFTRFEAVVRANAPGEPAQTVSLTHKEATVLRLLVDRRGKVVSRDEILGEAWSADEFPSPRTVDNFILRLRRLVEIDPENPAVIRSVRGVGYQLTEEGPPQ